jgi:hypothetical protein
MTKFIRDVAAAVVAGVVVLWVAAWNVPKIADALDASWHWLWASTHWPRAIVPLVLLWAIIATVSGARARRASRTLRGQLQDALSRPTATVVAGRPAPALPPEATKFDEIQRRALTVLLEIYPHWINLEQLNERCEQSEQAASMLMGRAHLAQEMELLAESNLVHIDTLGSQVIKYRVTEAGRNWLVDRMKRGREDAQKTFTAFKDIASDPEK